MSSGDGIQLLILILLLLMSAFFSSAETALTTVNKIRVRTLAENGDKQAEYVLKIIEDPSKMLSAILIGNNVVNLYASSLAAVLATHIWGNKIVGIATGILTLLILIFGEITPKTVATIQAERIAFRFAKIIYYIMTVLTPVIFVVNQLSFLVLKLLRVDVKAKGESITEDELRTIVEVSHEEGVIESEEKKMINNVFDFGDAVARDVMLPKVNMTFVDVDATYDELMEVFRSEKYTRYPVYEETTDNVIGILNVKDILLAGEREQLVRLGELAVDTQKGQVTRNGTPILLTALEYRLLLTFLSHPGQTLTRGQLLEGIWDVAGNFVNDNTLSVYIKRLRDKLEMPGHPLISTVRGMGYRLEVDGHDKK